MAPVTMVMHSDNLSSTSFHQDDGVCCDCQCHDSHLTTDFTQLDTYVQEWFAINQTLASTTILLNQMYLNMINKEQQVLDSTSHVNLTESSISSTRPNMPQRSQSSSFCMASSSFEMRSIKRLSVVRNRSLQLRMPRDRHLNSIDSLNSSSCSYSSSSFSSSSSASSSSSTTFYLSNGNFDLSPASLVHWRYSPPTNISDFEEENEENDQFDVCADVFENQNEQITIVQTFSVDELEWLEKFFNHAYCQWSLTKNRFVTCTRFNAGNINSVIFMKNLNLDNSLEKSILFPTKPNHTNQTVNLFNALNSVLCSPKQIILNFQCCPKTFFMFETSTRCQHSQAIQSETQPWVS